MNESGLLYVVSYAFYFILVEAINFQIEHDYMVSGGGFFMSGPDHRLYPKINSPDQKFEEMEM